MLNLRIPAMPAVVEKILACVKRVATSLWESVIVLFRTTGAYLAVGVLIFGGFWFGHIEASHGKREIRERMRAAESRAATLTTERDMALVEVRRLTAALAKPEAATAAKPAPAAKKGKVTRIFPSGDTN